MVLLRLWYVWETSRGRHVPDEDVIAEAVWLPQAVGWSVKVMKGDPIR